jgi:hypothetical protein
MAIFLLESFIFLLQPQDKVVFTPMDYAYSGQGLPNLMEKEMQKPIWL